GPGAVRLDLRNELGHRPGAEGPSLAEPGGGLLERGPRVRLRDAVASRVRLRPHPAAGPWGAGASSASARAEALRRARRRAHRMRRRDAGPGSLVMIATEQIPAPLNGL